MKKLLTSIICRSVNHARSTVHGRPSQQMRLGKKKKKKRKTQKEKTWMRKRAIQTHTQCELFLNF